MSAWAYSMFPAYSVKARASRLQGYCHHTRAVRPMTAGRCRTAAGHYF